MWTQFSLILPKRVLYLVLAICVALPYKIQHWTRFTLHASTRDATVKYTLRSMHVHTVCSSVIFVNENAKIENEDENENAKK